MNWLQRSNAFETIPRRLGPKRANNIRKLFNLEKEDDVRRYVIARTFTNKKGREVRKAPKIQRLITPLMLQHKRARKAHNLANILKQERQRGCRVQEIDRAAFDGPEGSALVPSFEATVDTQEPGPGTGMILRCDIVFFIVVKRNVGEIWKDEFKKIT